MSITRYPVERRLCPGLPQTPYRNGVGAYEGVVLHFTANYTSTIAGEVDWLFKNWRNAFVHEFVDAATAIQTADPNYKAWGAGQYANERFVHIELVVAHTKADFEKSFDRYCERAAEYLYARKLGVAPARPDGTGTLWSHADVTKYLGGTDHTDPIDYLAKWGCTWQAVVDRVSAYYNELLRLEGEHVVSAGDTLGGIAAKYGKTLGEVLALNPSIKNPATNHVGQVVRLVPKIDPIDQAMADAGVPEWARGSVGKALRKGALSDPKGSNDFYRVLAVLERLGILD